MSKKDWSEAWQRGEIGFHQSRTNTFLERYGKEVWGQTPGRVLVPLSGKSLDMVHLAESADAVIGIEFVEQAVEEFFTERELVPEISDSAPISYSAEKYILFAADFFLVTTDHTGPIDAVFDRASIVALDADTRTRFADHLASLMSSGAVMLLITFDYDQSEMAGPPFSVPNAELQSLFGDKFSIEILETIEAVNDEMRSRGVSSFKSTAYKMVRN